MFKLRFEFVLKNTQLSLLGQLFPNVFYHGEVSKDADAPHNCR